jgi:hypothetical protein
MERHRSTNTRTWPRVRRALVGLAAASLVAITLVTSQVALAGDGSTPGPSRAELDAYDTAYQLTSRVARLLDQLSDAANKTDEDTILAQIRPLLHPDITVTSDGRRFSGRETVLEGMRFAHSRLQDRATRLETSPTILESHLGDTPKTLTIGTVQAHWWVDPPTTSLNMANRKTEVTIEKVDDAWLIKSNDLVTVTGPIVVPLT